MAYGALAFAYIISTVRIRYNDYPFVDNGFPFLMWHGVIVLYKVNSIADSKW